MDDDQITWARNQRDATLKVAKAITSLEFAIVLVGVIMTIAISLS